MFSRRAPHRNAKEPIPSRKTGAERRHAAPLTNIMVAPNGLYVFSRVGNCHPGMKRVLNCASDEFWVLCAFPRGLGSAPITMATFASRSPPPPGVLDDDGSTHPAGPSPELAVALYEHMVVARALDERFEGLRHERAVTNHASAIGEEGTIVGSAAAMKDEDWVFPGPHDVAAALWRGMPLSAFAHHALGTVCAASKGRSSPDPPFWKAARVASTSPLAGTRIAHAVGLAWAARMRARDVAALVFCGPAAGGCGDLHCALNFAGVMKAPVIAVCRELGPRAPRTTSASFADKSVAYGLAGVRVDGSDVVAVWSVVRAARERASAGLGGTLVEAILTPEPKSDEAVGGGPLGTDPIARMRRHLERLGIWTADREGHLQSDVRADVDHALAAAAAAVQPKRETLFDDVYAELPWHLKEQRDT